MKGFLILGDGMGSEESGLASENAAQQREAEQRAARADAPARRLYRVHLVEAKQPRARKFYLQRFIVLAASAREAEALARAESSIRPEDIVRAHVTAEDEPVIGLSSAMVKHPDAALRLLPLVIDVEGA